MVATIFPALLPAAFHADSSDRTAELARSSSSRPALSRRIRNVAISISGDACSATVHVLGFAASCYESENRRKERFRLGRPRQRCPPGSHVPAGNLTGLRGPVNRSLVKLLVDSEPGRAGQADGKRDHPDVTQPRPP